MSFFQITATPWIGGYDYNEGGVWKWTDGNPWQFENWDTNQPSNVNKKDYLAIDLRTGKWSDEKGAKNPETIIEYDFGSFHPFLGPLSPILHQKENKV